MLYQLASFLLFTIAVLATAHHLALLPPRLLRALAARSRNKSYHSSSSTSNNNNNNNNNNTLSSTQPQPQPQLPPTTTIKTTSSSPNSHNYQSPIDTELGPPLDLDDIENDANNGTSSTTSGSFLSASSVLHRNHRKPSSFPLIHKSFLSESTAIYRFALPSPTDTLGLTPGQHITVLAPIHGKILSRSYTPVTLDSDFYTSSNSSNSSSSSSISSKKSNNNNQYNNYNSNTNTTTTTTTTNNYTNTRGYFDLLVKSYPFGNVSKHIASLPLGACIQVLGPSSSTGSFVYSPLMARHLNIIASGTGIIPIYQLLLYIFFSNSTNNFHHPHHYSHHTNTTTTTTNNNSTNTNDNNNNNHPSISLIYMNENERDVLLKHQLDSLPIQTTYIYTSSQPDSQGLDSPVVLSREILTKHTQLPDKNNHQSVRLLLSGPPPMVSAMRKVAVDAGYSPARKGLSRPDDQIFVFQ
ncbi:uncharacterized protein SAPINGB_P002728 [Magnusiomyces paraingens]|uniref:FAD-binding FR-type domain-containing protein n=1 Tax=Magnusiomyces paraingens TaxID=2606893 RepID=A0A5E8BL65_9ASCO|nr:uncharacterized protein SAPINGB_P002728 [Saprochaete ingens]VVT50368.1 unnamed protein product [Saprochaete ingens]